MCHHNNGVSEGTLAVSHSMPASAIIIELGCDCKPGQQPSADGQRAIKGIFLNFSTIITKLMIVSELNRQSRVNAVGQQAVSCVFSINDFLSAVLTVEWA